MNNFIVGQVTPEMLESITYGTYILFGLLTCLGAAFVWFVVPETKRLSLEEMDILFGSQGAAQADHERMREIHNEIGLSAALGHGGISGSEEVVLDKEKAEVQRV